jgi:hypothetical protein
MYGGEDDNSNKRRRLGDADLSCLRSGRGMKRGSGITNLGQCGAHSTFHILIRMVAGLVSLALIPRGGQGYSSIVTTGTRWC